MKRRLQNVLVTGGCGFIGSAFIRYLFTPQAAFAGRVINMDLLTYAGNKENVEDIETKYGKASDASGNRYFFVKADVADGEAVMHTMQEYDIDTVVHFAAESHVDRSIANPAVFMHTNVIGTATLLECARAWWESEDFKQRAGGEDSPRLNSPKLEGVIFHQVSTDEVYGDIAEGAADENARVRPSSPYAASKAAADLLCLSYHRTYGLPVTITRSSNNYGPRQYGEKFLPLMIEHIKNGLPLPVYGDGFNVRDWIHVEDNVRAIWAVVRGGEGVYNVAGGNERRNIDLLCRLIEVQSEQTGKDAAEVKNTIEHTSDRPGHDMRYCMDCTKIQKELHWKSTVPFDEGLQKTVEWYVSGT